MPPRTHTSPLSLLLLATLASAQTHTVNELSFGHRHENFADAGNSVPGFQLSSVNHEIQHLSDRLILTPPYPGNAKGALWTEATTTTSDWTAALEFRANGQDVGSGNLQLWYTKERNIGVNSIYNVEKFDGLAIVVDQYGGKGGKIRGFLNDGTKNFRTQSSLESLAFGQCDYHYRNRGEHSKLAVTSSSGGLLVKIDGRVCFNTESVRLPEGYHFGITASTGEQNPDSFELYNLIVSGGDEHWHHQHVLGPNVGESTSQQTKAFDAFPGIPEAIPDRTPSDFKSQEEQFADLHNRLQGLSHQMGNLFMEVKTMAESVQKQQADVLSRQGEVIQQVQNMAGSKESGLPPAVVGQIDDLVRRLTRVESSIEAVRKDIEDKDHREALRGLASALDGVHSGFEERLAHLFSTHHPRLGWFVFLVIAVQLGCVAGYVVYKRRRNGMPKKFL